MKQRRNHRLAVAVFAAGVLFAGAARSAEPVTIGFGMALTGGLAAGGKSALLAMQIWRDNVNAKGGPHGPAGQADQLRRPEQPGDRAGHLYKAARRRQGRLHRFGLRHQPDRAGDAGGDLARPGVPRAVRARGQQRVPLSQILLDAADRAGSETRLLRAFLPDRDGGEPEAEDARAARRGCRVPEERLRRHPRSRQDLRAAVGLRQDLPAGNA